MRCRKKPRISDLLLSHLLSAGAVPSLKLTLVESQGQGLSAIVDKVNPWAFMLVCPCGGAHMVQACLF